MTITDDIFGVKTEDLPVPFRDVLVNHFKIRNHNAGLFRQQVGLIQLIKPKALASSRLHPFPERKKFAKRQIVIHVHIGIVNQEKSNSVLLLKPTHKFNLVRMNVLQRKGRGFYLLCVKANRISLYNTDVVNGTFLFKIRKCNVPALLIQLNRRDRRRNFLNQTQILFFIGFVRPIDFFFQKGAPEAP